MNNFTAIGRLTRDPELKTTPNNIPVATFRIAINRSDGKNTDFLSCVAWRKTAEFLTKYFHKGDRLGLSGEVRSRDFTDKEGNSHFIVEILAHSLYFADGKRGGYEDYSQEYSANYTEFSKDNFEDSTAVGKLMEALSNDYPDWLTE
jgi:single-strand DNA-binding protein